MKIIQKIILNVFGVFIRMLPLSRGKAFIARLLLKPLFNNTELETIVGLKKKGEGRLYCIPADKSHFGIFLYGYSKSESIDGIEDYLLATAENKKIIFDVGTNIGYYMVKFAKLAHPHGIVHAFEPVHPTYQRCSRNIRLNRLENVTLNKLIVSKSIKPQNIYYSLNHSGAASLEKENEFVELVDSITIDQYCKEHEIEKIDLMKIDVEGHELSVLQGMEKLLKCGKIEKIFLEMFGNNLSSAKHTKNDITNYLAKFKYRGYKIRDHKIIPYMNDTNEHLVLFTQEHIKSN